jgi:type III pantothenate kinase
VKLLLDLGNSRLKWACWQDERLSDVDAVFYRGKDLAPLLDQVWGDLPVPAAVHGACVAPPAIRDSLVAWVSAHWGCPLHWLCTEAGDGALRNGYDEPAQLGVDRWLAMRAAWQRVGAAVCIIDCGSAITVDILDGDGRHLGGLIAPGLHLMQDALAAGTMLQATTGAMTLPLGRNTAACVRAGVTHALLGLIERARQLAPPGARLLLTGGDAAALAAGLDGPYELHPDLVLEGVAGTLAGD